MIKDEILLELQDIQYCQDHAIYPVLESMFDSYDKALSIVMNNQSDESLYEIMSDDIIMEASTGKNKKSIIDKIIDFIKNAIDSIISLFKKNEKTTNDSMEKLEKADKKSNKNFYKEIDAKVKNDKKENKNEPTLIRDIGKGLGLFALGAAGGGYIISVRNKKNGSKNDNKNNDERNNDKKDNVSKKRDVDNPIVEDIILDKNGTFKIASNIDVFDTYYVELRKYYEKILKDSDDANNFIKNLSEENQLYKQPVMENSEKIEYDTAHFKAKYEEFSKNLEKAVCSGKDVVIKLDDMINDLNTKNKNTNADSNSNNEDAQKAIQTLTKFINIIKDITKKDVEFARSLSSVMDDMDEIAFSTFVKVGKYGIDEETICPNCSSLLYKGSNFCIKCGAKLSYFDLDSEEKWKEPKFEENEKCHLCGSDVIKISNYCWKCGVRLYDSNKK